MNGFDKLQNAALLIEEMTNSQFVYGPGGAYISPDREDYLTVNMRKDMDFDAGLYRIRFDAGFRTTGTPMGADGLARLKDEAAAVHALLTLLEESEYSLTPEEMQKFDGYVRGVIAAEQAAGPGMGPQSM